LRYGTALLAGRVKKKKGIEMDNEGTEYRNTGQRKLTIKE
jgi:hypothetical protein